MTDQQPEPPPPTEAWETPPSYAPPPQGYAQPPQGYTPGYPTPQRGSSDDTLWAVLCHLSFFVLGLIGPLVVLLTKGRESPFVRHHAAEALNFHITVLIASIVSGILILLIIGIFLLIAVIAGAVVFTIIAAVAAGRGELYRYPLPAIAALRVVRGAALAAALALTACGGSADPQPVAKSSPPAPSTSAAATPSAVPTPAGSPAHATPASRAASTAARATRAPAAPLPTTRPASSAARPAGYDYAFPVAGCATSYAHSHHDYPATDIFALAGCAVVAPVTGRVDEVTTIDTWDPRTNLGAARGGLSVSVVGVDGVRYYGSHLSAVAAGIRPGALVRVGGRLGSVGNTGSARGTATHLHYGISWPTRAGVWWVRRGELYPWPYLDSWRAGGNASPAAAVAALHVRLGDLPPCRSYC